MKKEYEVWQYKNLLKTKIIMLLLGLAVPCIELLTKDSFDEVEWGFVIIPPVVAISIVLLLELLKFVLATILLSLDVDVKSAAGILKRKENKKNHAQNKLWDATVCYFDGDFNGLFSCVRDIELTGEEEVVFGARHLQIMALFIMNEFDEVKKLIELQKPMLERLPAKKVTGTPIYYEFFLNFILKDYEKSVEIFEDFLNKKGNLNNRKLSLYYFLRMAYKELGNEEQVERCTYEISLCDKERLTFFTRH